MIIEYDVNCFERILRIKFPDGYEYLREQIPEMLDGYYFEWHDVENIKDTVEQKIVQDSCLEEYMMDRLSETYNMWEWWDTDYYGDNTEEMTVETVPVKNEDLRIVKNLITAMADYALDNAWSDSEMIDVLVGVGITEQDFINCGYGDFVKDYFKED